nr:peptidoglycan-binding domain-containing protein [Bradyrhizobium lablabi]
MPKKISGDDDMPRRRRGARAVAIEADAERGLLLRVLLHSPKDTFAGALAFAAVVAIIVNALFLQTGHHPAPMFGSVIVMPQPVALAPSPLPRPRPVEADATPSEPKPVLETKPAPEPRAAQESKPPPEPKPVAEPKPAEPKAADPLGNLVKTTAAMPPAATSSIPRPPAPIPLANPATRRVAAVQRALTEYGYGQLKPTGTVGTDTQAAIAKFERERKLPVTGQVSERLVRELTTVIGHSID